MEITFSNPVYLWGLITVPILVFLYFFSLKYSKKTALKFANFVALSRVSGGVDDSSSISTLIVRVSAVICIILSISGMTFWYIGSTANKDYVIAIDSSASMMKEDFFPSRLDAAKIAAINFVNELPFNSRVGVLSFSGTSFVNQPITNEKILVRESINEIQPSTVGGTDFGNAIITATNILIPSNKAKMIILLTDGRSNIGISEESAIAYAIDHHITVSTIGVGPSNEDLQGNLELGVDEEALKNIADLTLGTYYHAENSDDLEEIYSKIMSADTIGKNPIDLSFILLVIALGLLLFDWLLGSTIYRRII